MKYSIRFGYACINTILRENGIFPSRSLILSTLHDKGIKEAKRLAMLNLEDVLIILRWNEEHNIRLYRLSSNMFPHIINPQADQNYTLKFAKDKLKEIGDYAKKYNHRLTFHPGQYTQLASNSARVHKQSLKELALHAKILDYMGLDSNSIMIVHGGGVYGNKENTLKELDKNISKLPLFIKNRLCLENDEFSYSVFDLLPLCIKHKLPFCFDVFHHKVMYNKKADELVTKDLIENILRTWTNRELKPKFHLSNQKKMAKRGSHSDYVNTIPEYLLDLPNKYKINIDVMLEAKQKEQAVFRLIKKLKM
jgi:UV DNA damage endonuclease